MEQHSHPVAVDASPELLNGQRFDINRPFGNGRDDDGDGVVDEPDEYYLGEPAWINPTGASSPMTAGTSPFPSNTTSPATNLAVDWNGDGTIDGSDALMARHVMARHLYVLAMMLVDPSPSPRERVDRDPVRRRQRKQ